MLLLFWIDAAAVPAPLESWLFQMMLFAMVGLLLLLFIPPPEVLALLPLMVTLLSVGMLLE